MQDEKLHIKKELIKNLEELTQEEGFIYSLCYIIYDDHFFSHTEAAHINWHERLIYQEVSFLLGLMVKHKINFAITPTKEHFIKQVNSVYEFFEKLHSAHIQPLPKIIFDDKADVNDKEKASNDFDRSGAVMTEPIFYGGTGAYDFQYWQLAPIKYEDDSDWIKENKSISIAEMTSISVFIKNNVRNKIKKLKDYKDFSDYCKALLTICSFTIEDLASFDKKVVEKFLEAFSLRPGNVNKDFDSIGAYNATDSHPIIILDNNSYFLPIGINLAQSIYESPFYWMANDKEYKDTAFKNRGAATENIAFNLLQNVFRKDSVFKNVKISKSKGEYITDIDVLAVAGNKAVIIQAKSKKLTELSKKGNEEQLIKDFNEAVQKAYDQGIICRTSLLSDANTLITEDGNKLILEEKIDDAYIICLTTDYYPAITHQTNIYLERKSENPFPLTISVFDLEILVFYLKDPFEFLYYLRQRINLASYYRADNEMTFLGYHLQYNLFPKETEANGVWLHSEFAQSIDANFPPLRSSDPKVNSIRRLHPKWKNPKFEELISQVKSGGLAGFTDAIFFLYDLAGKRADDIISQIEIAKRKTNTDNKLHGFSTVSYKEKNGITFISYPGSFEKMKHNLIGTAIARKYLEKANVWLGFGSIPNSPNIIDTVTFHKDPWTEDKEVEVLAKNALKQSTPMNFGKKKGRNDPCPCGSGKKYKKCHGNTMQS